MEILNSILGTIDSHFLFGMTLILSVICLFYYSSAKKQVSIIHKLEISLKHFEQINHQMALSLKEQRCANNLLSELAGVELPYHATDHAHNEPLMNGYANTHHFEGERPNHAHNVHNIHNMRNVHGADYANNMNEGSELNSQTKLYVGNIDYSATEVELGAHFARFGQIEFVNIPVNRYTGRARGFGFVTFDSKESAERAISLNGSEFKGRQIQVNFAKERDLSL